jgi:hypothetical protein
MLVVEMVARIDHKRDQGKLEQVHRQVRSLSERVCSLGLPFCTANHSSVLQLVLTRIIN